LQNFLKKSGKFLIESDGRARGAVRLPGGYLPRGLGHALRKCIGYCHGAPMPRLRGKLAERGDDAGWPGDHGSGQAVRMSFAGEWVSAQTNHAAAGW
jgi:hypothetical protein